MTAQQPRRWFSEAADDELTIFERSQTGRSAFVVPETGVPERPLDELLPAHLRRAEAPRLPEVSNPSSYATTTAFPSATSMWTLAFIRSGRAR